MITGENQHDLNLLAAHLEDRLDGQERERLTLHLASCAECRETLATLARGADLLPHPASAAPAPPKLWQLPGGVWLPLAATLIVAVATLTRLGWWTPAEEGQPAAAASASPTPARETPAPARPSPTEDTAPRSAPATPPATRTGAPPASAVSDEQAPVLRGAPTACGRQDVSIGLWRVGRRRLRSQRAASRGQRIDPRGALGTPRTHPGPGTVRSPRRARTGRPRRRGLPISALVPSA